MLATSLAVGDGHLFCSLIKVMPQLVIHWASFRASAPVVNDSEMAAEIASAILIRSFCSMIGPRLRRIIDTDTRENRLG